MVGFNAHLQTDLGRLLSYFISSCISCNQHEPVFSHFPFSVQRSEKTENDISSASRTCNCVVRGDENISGAGVRYSHCSLG